MPTRDVLKPEWFSDFMTMLKTAYNDFSKMPCDSTLAFFIAQLYEVSMVVCTLKYDNRKMVANYMFVRHRLPNPNGVNAFVTLRDDFVHNHHKVKGVKKHALTYLSLFGKENFDAVVWETVGVVTNWYDEILHFCAGADSVDLSPVEFDKVTLGQLKSVGLFNAKEVKSF